MEQKSRVKFKIMSLKVKGAMDYVPELVCKMVPLAFSFIGLVFSCEPMLVYNGLMINDLGAMLLF